MDDYTPIDVVASTDDAPSTDGNVIPTSRAPLEDDDDYLSDYLLSPEELAEIDGELSLRGLSPTLDQVDDYVDRGWSIVPQMPGSKSPRIKWKVYQSERPTKAQLLGWFSRWADAGPAVVLGPLSGVVAIDVDGTEAHCELVRRLGQVPSAPTVLSGSGKPHRYHLFFRCPEIVTTARATPWHKQLEFRGHGGIVVLPPALHPSGRRYRWAPDRSLHVIELPPLPETIIDAWRKGRIPSRPTTRATQHNAKVVLIPGISRKTRGFLSGRFANSPRWNARLFGAACDLAGNEIPLDRALPLLLAAAGPWDSAEEAKAEATIRSAYASPRLPAGAYSAKQT